MLPIFDLVIIVLKCVAEINLKKGYLQMDIVETEKSILREAGFYYIRKSENGTYCATHNITTYYGLYIIDGTVRQS